MTARVSGWQEVQDYFADLADGVLHDGATQAFNDKYTDDPEPPDDDLPPPVWTNGADHAPRERQERPAKVHEVDLWDFLAAGADDEQEEWLVQGLVPQYGLTILGGHPKSGKTLLALDLCVAVAAGRPFFGRETTPASFVFVTEEGSPGETRKRLRRLLERGGPVALQRGETRTGGIFHRKGIHFDDVSTWQAVTESLARFEGPVLLVLDPLRDMILGDENDSTAIAAVGRAITAILRDFPLVTVVLLHHLTKRGEGEGGRQLRGSTALWAKADCTLILSADPIPNDASEGEVELRGSLAVEPRNAERGKFWWRWDKLTGRFLESAAEARSLADKVADTLFTEGPKTTNDLADEFGTTTDTMRHSLGRDPRFRSRPGVRPHDPSIWELVG